MQTNLKENKIYFIVLSTDGKFHQTVPNGTIGAVLREYEDKAGAKKSKWELIHDSVSGHITNISFKDSDFGKVIKIELDGEGVMSFSTNSSFGTDIMKKLPGMDLSLFYKFVPYSFKADNGKIKKGVSVYQGETKIDSFYYNPMTKKSTNGMPEPEGDTKEFDSDDWKMYFTTKVKKFLISEVEKIINKGANQLDIDYPDEEIAPEDIPF